eukprot:comp17850_c0_seq1/m.18020 comp17850_c0_seq1/g.18020  ORF comp17850_c0_seq1/g.18020 comp17850_c0_seq1/m.18020 type:complete len:492 (-) comp17850_c0_seq1:298-1773(-)
MDGPGRQATPAGGGSADIPPLRPDVEGLAVLCAEDNNVLQRMLGKWFETMPLPLTQVYDGVRALEACEKTKFGIIFTDVAMPALDGVEAARLIRSKPTSLNQKTPIVCFSGLNTDAISNSGVNDFLRKPFTRTQLVHCINRWAGREVGPEDNFIDPSAPPPQNDEQRGAMQNQEDGGENGVPATEMKSRQAPPTHRQAVVGEPQPRMDESSSVLFVASDPPTQRLVANFLAGRAHTVHQAYDMSGALNMAQSVPLDVVLVDTSDAMAAECVYQIRKGNTSNRLVPIIALSSYGKPVEFITQGFNDMLSKPFNKIELTSIVDKWLPFQPSLYESARQNGQEPSHVFCMLGYTVDPPRPGAKIGVPQPLPSEPPTDSNPPSSHERQPSRRNAAKSRQSLEQTGDDSTDGQGSKRKRSRRGGNEPEDKRLRVEQSRMSHNEKERSRRQDITDTVHDFRTMVPGCTDKTDKATVLRKGVEYLQGLIELAKQQNLI